MSKRISIKGAIYFDTDDMCDMLGWSRYTFVRGTHEKYGSKLFVCEHTLTVDIPDDFDPRAGQIEALQEQKRKAMAEFQATMTAIDKRISELQAIEYTEQA